MSWGAWLLVCLGAIVAFLVTYCNQGTTAGTGRERVLDALAWAAMAALMLVVSAGVGALMAEPL